MREKIGSVFNLLSNTGNFLFITLVHSKVDIVIDLHHTVADTKSKVGG